MLQWASGERLPISPVLALPDSFPLKYQPRKDEHGETTSILLREPALSFPWNNTILKKELQITPPGGWRYDSDSHRLWLVKPLGLLIFCSGWHSGTVGILQGGAALAETYDINQFFEQGLKIAWTGENAIAFYPNGAHIFEYPEWGLLWWAAFILWEKGKSVDD